MKLRKKRLIYRNIVYLHPEGTDKAFLIDRKFIRRVREVRWLYLPDRKRVRGYFGRSKTRLYLHRFILQLAGKYYPEVTFANGDYFDCRLANLKPYRREIEGANRCLFKNSSTKRKGVSFHRGKWVAMIRAKGKLRHLGRFDDPDLAANAYHRAWKLAHPEL